MRLAGGSLPAMFVHAVDSGVMAGVECRSSRVVDVYLSDGFAAMKLSRRDGDRKVARLRK